MEDTRVPLKSFLGMALCGGVLLLLIVLGLAAPRWFQLRSAMVPAGPEVESTIPAPDVLTLKAGQEEQINSYRLIDAEGGVVAIPIEAAMALEVTKQKGE